MEHAEALFHCHPAVAGERARILAGFDTKLYVPHCVEGQCSCPSAAPAWRGIVVLFFCLFMSYLAVCLTFLVLVSALFKRVSDGVRIEAFL